MNAGSIIIFGRGRTAYDFDWHANTLPIMAVSSGIFALPNGIVPQHFVTLDGAHFFNSPLNEHAIAWKHDPRARQWPFWSDAAITKHVHELNAAPGRYKPFPMAKALDAVKLCRNPENAKARLLDNFEWLQSHYGHQPNWGDYSNVRPWRVVVGAQPDFVNVDAPVGLNSMRNSVFMALQIAARLGYSDIRCVGIFDGEGYGPHLETFARWQDIASTHNINISRNQPALLETAA